MARVRDTVTPEGRRMLSELGKLKRLQVRVGFQQGDAQEDDGTDICDVAMWNELGTSNAPSRPFMRDSVDDNIDKINAFLKVQLKKLVTGGTDAESVLKAIGVFQKGLVQKQIIDGDFEPNAPSTIKRKGSDKPLVDTGRMRQSVNFVVKEKGGM